MYPYEVATMFDVLGRKSHESLSDHGRSPVPVRESIRFHYLRRMAGRQLIRLGEALAGNQPVAGVPLATGARRS